MAYFRRDENRVPIAELGLIETKSVLFSALTTGAIGASTLFTVTGDVVIRIFAKCTSELVSGGSPTIEVGISGNTASLLAQTPGTALDNAEIWIDADPATVEALPAYQILVEGTDIIQTIGTATITSGILMYYCLWTPLSEGASVVAA